MKAIITTEGPWKSGIFVGFFIVIVIVAIGFALTIAIDYQNDKEGIAEGFIDDMYIDGDNYIIVIDDKMIKISEESYYKVEKWDEVTVMSDGSVEIIG